MDNEALQIPAIGFSLSVNLDGTKENYNNLVCQFHFPFTFTKEEMDENVDKIFHVIERRKLCYRLEQLKRSLEEHEAFIPNAKQDLIKLHNQHQEAHIGAGRKGPYKPGKSEAQQIQMAKNNIQNTEIVITRIKSQIEATERKLGSASSTNSSHRVSKG